MLRKSCFILLALLMIPFCAQADEPFHILATNFPCFDIARSITGEDVNMLLPPGSESHSYEPTPQDIIAIQNADLFIYVGGVSDHWIEEILYSLGEQAPRTFRLTDSVTLLEEEMALSMEHRHEHDHEHEHENAQMDEHVWTSPRNVMAIAKDLCQTMSNLHPEKSDVFSDRLHSYLQELEKLDQDFTETVRNGQRDLIIFGDRFPLRYFAAAYGLKYDAAFPGCSEDSEPSVRTVISLVDTVREQRIPVVFYIEFSSRRTADILAEETGAKALLFHSCHNVSAAEIEQGATYLTLMRHNAQVLKEALN